MKDTQLEKGKCIPDVLINNNGLLSSQDMQHELIKGIYAITDCDNHKPVEMLDKTEKLLNGGIALLQYRDKKNNYETKIQLANKLKQLCSHYNVPLIINDDIRIAKQVSAEGVHLGNDDESIKNARRVLGPVIIGKSCYNKLENAGLAIRQGASYIAYGAFFQSATKPQAVTALPGIIKESKSLFDSPVVAIGGITIRNAEVLIDSGADMLAICRGLYETSDISITVKEFNKLFINK